MSSLVVLNHLLGWYGYARGMGAPPPFDRAAVEFGVLFAVLFLVFLALALLRARSKRPLTNVVICPACRNVSSRFATASCRCNLPREDLTNWVWENDDHSLETPEPLNPERLTVTERFQVWLVKFFEG